MSFRATVLQVLIASPGDVTEERAVVAEEIQRWNDAHSEVRNIVLRPLRWETHVTPRFGKSPQDEVNSQIADGADLLIGIFGARIGTPTDLFVSGTVEEIRRHVAAGKTAKIYFSNAPVPLATIDTAQLEAVRAFREEIRGDGIYGEYFELAQFRSDFKQHLDIELNSARYRWLNSESKFYPPQEKSKPVEVALSVQGEPQIPVLTLRSEVELYISAIDYLLPSGVTEYTQQVNETSAGLSLCLNYDVLRRISFENQSAKLLIRCRLNGDSKKLLLTVGLKSGFLPIGNTSTSVTIIQGSDIVEF